MQSGRFAVFAALMTSAHCAVALAEESTPQFGPFRLNMSVDEARAAAPGVSWKETESPDGRFGSIVAPGVVQFDDRSFDVEFQVRRDGNNRLIFSDVQPTGDAFACEARAIGMIADLESRYGRFAGAAPEMPRQGQGSLTWNVTRSPGGAAVVTPQAIPGPLTGKREFRVSAGKGSSATIAAWDKRLNSLDEAKFRKAGKVYGFEIKSFAALGDAGAERTFLKVSTLFDQGIEACGLEFVAIRAASPPPPTILSPESVKLRSGPSIGQIHRQAVRGELPASRVKFDFDCLVSRSSGAVHGCKYAGTPPADSTPSQVLTARDRAHSYVLELGAMDPDDPAPLGARISVELAPTDRRPLDFLDDPATASRMRWVQEPRASDLDRAYPLHARRSGLQTIVNMTCQVQADYSLVCGGAVAHDPALLTVFEDAALDAMLRYRAAETFEDGTPSLGTVIRRSVNFNLAN